MQHIVTHADTHPNEDPYESLNLLHAIWWGVDAWKTGAKLPTLENCFTASQVNYTCFCRFCFHVLFTLVTPATSTLLALPSRRCFRSVTNTVLITPGAAD